MTALRKIATATASLVLAAYSLVAMVMLPYYNWQYARDHGFLAWFFFGEVMPTVQALAWPYFVFFSDPRTSDVRLDAGPPMNASELERYSRILAKLHTAELTQGDLDELRTVFRDYIARTGRYTTRAEMRVFGEKMKLASDYEHEHAKSMLFSWDQRSYFTTQAFDTLFKQMQGDRKPELLESDLDGIRAASTHRTYVNAADGTKRTFDREAIVEIIRKNEVSKRNLQTLAAVLQESVRR